MNSTASVGPGVLVIADVRPRYAAVIEVIAHDGAEIRRLSDTSTLVTAPHASTFYCAYYTTDVARNEWEPCDQAVAAAYMPLRYSSLTLRSLEDGGAFLIQRQPFHERVWRNVVGDDVETCVLAVTREDTMTVADKIASLLKEAGVPPAELSECVAAIRDRLDTIN